MTAMIVKDYIIEPGANLAGANLFEAYLTGADLTGAIMPDGSIHD